MMSFEDAREQLLFHVSSDPRVDDPRWENGLLATFRPYRGLRRDVMENVDQCVIAVEEHLRTAPAIDRHVVNALWAIVHYGRAWALDEGSMLQRNHLISHEDKDYLAKWLDDLSGRVALLLDVCQPEKGRDGP